MAIKRTRIQTARSRNGCLTCRSRHIKCDEALPVCANCIKSNKVCERGAKLNFLKSMVFKPLSPVDQSSILKHSRLQNFNFLDQSYSIHNLYKEISQFHDYSNWLTSHSELELSKSDLDIKEALQIQNNSPTNQKINNPTIPTQIHLHRNSPKPHLQPSEKQSRASNNESIIDDASDSDSLQNNNPNFSSNSVTRLRKLSNLKNIDESMFVYSEKPSFITPPNRIFEQEKISLQDFANAIDYLDNSNTSQNDQNLPNLTFPIFLSALVNGVKLKKLNGLFKESYLSSKITSYVTESLKVEENQTYDNLMNFFDFLLIDLNNSLICKKPMKIIIHDENIEFILKKVLSWSLFDDLNYFLIEVIVILMKLNNLYHRPQIISKGMHLTTALRRLKQLENNHFIRSYIPSTPSFETDDQVQTNEKSLVFQNLKVRRFHIYFNFTILFIFKQLVLTEEQTQLMVQTTILARYWISYNLDPLERIRVMIENDHQYEYSKDPFLNFITTRTS